MQRKPRHKFFIAIARLTLLCLLLPSEFARAQAETTGSRSRRSSDVEEYRYSVMGGPAILSSNLKSTTALQAGFGIDYGLSRKWGIQGVLTAGLTLSGFEFISTGVYAGALYALMGSLTRNSSSVAIDSSVVIDSQQVSPSTLALSLGFQGALFAGSANTVVLAGFGVGLEYIFSSRSDSTWKTGFIAGRQSNTTSDLTSIWVFVGKAF